MKCPQLLFVCWCLLTVGSSITDYRYSCVTSFWNTVACVLNITADPGANTSYSLKFRDTEENRDYMCPLTLKDHTYRCVCRISQRAVFSTYPYIVSLCTDSRHHFLESFDPGHHIQLTPPFEVEVQQMTEVFNITWKSGYENHKYMRNILQYELLLQKSPNHENRTLPCRETLVSLPRLQFDAHATYCARVRSKPSRLGYSGIWSEWSPPICWKNEVQEEQKHIIITLTTSLVPLCVAVGVLLFVFHSPAVRMKIKTLSHTPSPAPFFHPLFQQNEGNLKEWFSPQGKFALTCKTDEILITHAVTVEPKPKTMDPDENPGVYNTAITQLTFPQCQTSYVGLPEMNMAPRAMATVRPAGDTPYTKLPGSVWGFTSGEEQATPSPPQDAFESSTADSGCSFEDLTQSPDCSLLNSPVEASSLPPYCKDYCILNKTAEGLIPVLCPND